MQKSGTPVSIPLLLFCLLTGYAKGQGTLLQTWINQSDLVFSAQIFLTDTANPDYAHRGWGHMRLNAGTDYKYAESLHFEQEERYVHYRVQPGGFHPVSGQRYVFFVKRMQEAGRPDFLCLVDGSEGAVQYTKGMELSLCALLYPKIKDSLACQNGSLSIPFQHLNEGTLRESVLALAVGLPDKAWQTLVPGFLCVLQSDRFQEGARLGVMWLLGHRQCREAIPLLVSRVGEDLSEEGHGSQSTHELQSWEALREIGLPAWKPVEQHLDKCRNYQEFKYCILVLNGIKPFKNAARFHDFAEAHYASAPPEIKPWYRYMLLDMAAWERETLIFRDSGHH